MSRNIKLTLSYDGHDFAGWQVQPGRPTIQGTLVSVIEHITGETTLPQGSGRTDAGVHAHAQTASVAIESPIPLLNFRRALNDILPPAIRVLSAEEVPAEFHARRSAVAKTYRYIIYRGEICGPFLARYVYHHPYPLDEGRMKEAAGVVAGEHDFTSFAAVDPEMRKAGAGVNNIRTIYSSNWQRSGEELVYTVRGNGFLHHMVRNLVGTFLMAGKGNLTADGVKGILEARDRSAAAATAPASGLFLTGVEY
ncbi:MAG TPA: tRNA pseudouridine(38-40) synthase TruA [Candidatus Saccharimonadales bacterium]|jgi:tRNA pseudouridine38-40 synthase|nr:tRNA pseudouridine(38-40) synthase TruA [Candidatus Saccharimonadales bacterium]